MGLSRRISSRFDIGIKNSQSIAFGDKSTLAAANHINLDDGELRPPQMFCFVCDASDDYVFKLNATRLPSLSYRITTRIQFRLFACTPSSLNWVSFWGSDSNQCLSLRFVNNLSFDSVDYCFQCLRDVFDVFDVFVIVVVIEYWYYTNINSIQFGPKFHKETNTSFSFIITWLVSSSLSSSSSICHADCKLQNFISVLTAFAFKKANKTAPKCDRPKKTKRQTEEKEEEEKKEEIKKNKEKKENKRNKKPTTKKRGGIPSFAFVSHFRCVCAIGWVILLRGKW